MFACLFVAFLFAVLTCVGQTKKAAVPTTKLRAAQRLHRLNPRSILPSRVSKTPADIIKQFKDAGMSPTEHRLSKEERRIISEAFSTLPLLHQQVLKEHLKSISFLDNMPNTALTAPVTTGEGINLYHITFRAGILHQTITDWVTEKERTCFTGGDSSIHLSIQAGFLNALTYVLLHESTHVVDGSLRLISGDSAAGKHQLNSFTASFSKGLWKNINTYSWSFTDSIIIKSRFRPGGRRFLYDEAPMVYEALSRTPFVSLYSTASWHEDLAELLTVYHLTQVLNQPFRLTVTKNGKEVFSAEPMNSALVQERLKLLKYFYGER